jgi:hypothetical protein
MPTITKDPQLECLAGIVAARLNRATADSCNQAATRAPMLFAYRVGEKFARWGNGSKYGRVATCKLLYVLCTKGGDHLELAQYALSWAVEMMTDAIISGSDPSYLAGAKMETLASIEQIEPGDIEVAYNLDTEFPQVELTVVMKHRWSRTSGTAVPIAEITGNFDLNVDLDAITVEYEPGKVLTMAPLTDGVVAVLKSGATVGVSVTDSTVTLTCVIGVTTLAALAALVAAHTSAKLMIGITGTAGVMLSGAYGPQSFDLSRPIARQTSDTI